MNKKPLLLMICFLVGCRGGSSSFAETPAPADARTVSLPRTEMEDDVREAVLRAQFEHFTRGIGFEVARYYLSSVRVRELRPGAGPRKPGEIHPPPLRGKDPDAEFMARFEEDIPPVKGVSQCTNEGTWSVRDRTTGEKGCVFWTGEITWAGATEVEAEAGQDVGMSHAHEVIYRLVCENGGWHVKDSKLLRARGSR